ncbi:TetR/AcrR family transcriptional regulator [Demequina sp. NBRC 110053]|uniref:TetR/AcrR family transcriptional regulator n=1 Tax=Demequina sp. NBRC 110053 TaxID=1570342 RepID=UPI0009FE5158|nr:TetR family transcriptional regulator [Demequina sp. NBRC 110053]
MADHARRAPLSRERVLREALQAADDDGLEALSMRALADRLGVVPMALYKHVRGKDELLDAMVDAVVAEIGPPPAAGPWPERARALILQARAVMLAHPWAWRALETRTLPSPAVLDHMERMIRVLRDGGVSVDLTHHMMHTLGSRLWGFSQEVFASPSPPAAGPDPETLALMAERWPGVLESAASARHDDGTTVGPGCDDAAEFAFAVDLLLDGAERLHRAGWTAGTSPP